MKKVLVITLAVSLILTLCACTPTPGPSVSISASSGNVLSATVSPEVSAAPAETPAASVSATAAITPSPTVSGPEMYSSYAHLDSFDPATGIAQFDYFDMLRGDEAIQYLVDHEGYTQAEAEEYVNNFADSEYIEKNTNPQLRAIDLTHLSLSLMFQPSGAEVSDATPVPSTYSDFLAIWTLDSNLLLNTYFYYIHVESDGHVSLVEQVYWP